MEKHLREGFEGQEMFVIPRPILAEARRHPLVRLFPTDIGGTQRRATTTGTASNGAPEDHLMMCMGRHGYVVVNDKKSHLRAGELLIIPAQLPGTPTGRLKMTSRGRFTGCISGVRTQAIMWIAFPHVAEPVVYDQSTRDEAVRLFHDCLETLEDGYALPTLIYAAQSAKHILSVLLFRNAALPMKQSSIGHRLDCDAIIEYMRSRLHESVRLEEFARHAGLSVSYFSELFREQVHQSPLSYFTQLKIRAACRLLDLSGKSVKVVAMETGYSDPYYFSRVFKKVMGISPDKYRAIKKG